MPSRNRANPAALAPLKGRFFRNMVERLPHMVWTARPDGALDYVNDHLLAYAGVPPGQVLGWRWTDFVHPDELEATMTRWKNALASGQGYTAENCYRRHDGEYRWHMEAVVPWQEDGRITHWFGTVTDIHERKSALRRLEEARRSLETVLAARTEALARHDVHLRRFLDTLPAIAWIKDSRLRYAWVSASYLRAYGRESQEIVGRDDFELWPAELARAFQRDEERVLKANTPLHSIDSAPLADGAPGRWLVVRFPIVEASGELGVGGIGFDLAPLKGTADEAGSASLLGRLSARERQVLQLVVDGCTSAEVAAKLGLSPKTIDSYRSRLMLKLGVDDLPGLVKFALRHGITTFR